MTTAEFLNGLLRANLALAAAVVLVAMLRIPARRWLGAQTAYRLWALPALAAMAVLLPARIITVTLAEPDPVPAVIAAPAQAAPAVDETATQVAGAASPVRPQWPADPWPLLLAGWLAGAAAFSIYLAVRQRRFLALAARGEAGPAAVGTWRPRIVLPADFAGRFSAGEREAVLAHEAAHLAGLHPQVNGVVAAARAVCWFNPAVHLGAHLMRMDQELACDAAVIAKRPQMRRLYAQTLLKSQLAATPLPLGCYWPAKAEHPLTMRVEMLNTPVPGRKRRIVGALAVGLIAAGAAAATWAAQPPQVRFRLAVAAQRSALTQADVDQAWLLMRSLEADIANQERFLDRAPDPAAMRAFIGQERAKIADIKGRIAGRTVSEALRRTEGGALEAQRNEWADVARWDGRPQAGRSRATVYCSDAGTCALKSLTPAGAQGYADWALRFAQLVQKTAPEHLGEGHGMLIKVDVDAGTIRLPVAESLLQSTPQRPAQISYFLGLGPKGLPISVVPPPPHAQRMADAGGTPNLQLSWDALADFAAPGGDTGQVVQAFGRATLTNRTSTTLSVRAYGATAGWRTVTPQGAAAVRFSRDGGELRVQGAVADHKGKVTLGQSMPVKPGAGAVLPLPDGTRVYFVAEVRKAQRGAGGEIDADVAFTQRYVAETGRQHEAGVVTAEAFAAAKAMGASHAAALRASQGKAPSINFSADRVRNEGEGRLTLEGDAVVTFGGDLALRGDKITVDHAAGTATSDKRSALEAGDWRKAASFGASAADVVRALQAKRLYRDLEPDQAVVIIGRNNELEALALKPLPGLDGAPDTRTAPLAGTGFEFSRMPGSIILYPVYAERSMSQSGR